MLGSRCGRPMTMNPIRSRRRRMAAAPYIPSAATSIGAPCTCRLCPRWRTSPFTASRVLRRGRWRPSSARTGPSASSVDRGSVLRTSRSSCCTARARCRSMCPISCPVWGPGCYCPTTWARIPCGARPASTTFTTTTPGPCASTRANCSWAPWTIATCWRKACRCCWPCWACRRIRRCPCPTASLAPTCTASRQRMPRRWPRA